MSSSLHTLFPQRATLAAEKSAEQAALTQPCRYLTGSNRAPHSRGVCLHTMHPIMLVRFCVSASAVSTGIHIYKGSTASSACLSQTAQGSRVRPGSSLPILPMGCMAAELDM